MQLGSTYQVEAQTAAAASSKEVLESWEKKR